MNKKNISKWKKCISSFFYLGNLKGGGTYTSIIIAAIIFFFLDWDSIPFFFIIFLMTLVAFILSSDLEKDPDWFTLDEAVGTLFMAAGHSNSLSLLFIGLITFRILDIFKLPVLKNIEKKKGGIVLDDILAGIIANAFLWIIILMRRI